MQDAQARIAATGATGGLVGKREIEERSTAQLEQRYAEIDIRRGLVWGLGANEHQKVWGRAPCCIHAPERARRAEAQPTVPRADSQLYVHVRRDRMCQWPACAVCRRPILPVFVCRHAAVRRTSSSQQAWNQVCVVVVVIRGKVCG